jgi:hypothetical protein
MTSRTGGNHRHRQRASLGTAANGTTARVTRALERARAAFALETAATARRALAVNGRVASIQAHPPRAGRRPTRQLGGRGTAVDAVSAASHSGAVDGARRRRPAVERTTRPRSHAVDPAGRVCAAGDTSEARVVGAGHVTGHPGRALHGLGALPRAAVDATAVTITALRRSTLRPAGRGAITTERVRVLNATGGDGEEDHAARSKDVFARAHQWIPSMPSRAGTHDE